ncbi:MAG TPA: PTS sugar transporter subunit IIA [Thermoanaerobaculia bacterium]
MIGKLILTHGGVAHELLAAAEVISGPISGIEALSLSWDDTTDQAKAKVAAALERLDKGEGVLILLDMFGGTPCNVASTFLERGKVEILSGVNLPMVLKLACLQESAGGLGLTELARLIQMKTQKSVCLASDMVPEKSCCAGLPVPVETKHG